MIAISLTQYANDLKVSRQAAYNRVFKSKKRPGIVHAEKVGHTCILYKSADYEVEIKNFKKR